MALFGGHAYGENNETIDELFKQFDQGDVIEPATLQTKIQRLESLVDKNDLKSQAKLIAIKCWNPDAAEDVYADEGLKYAKSQLMKLAGQPPSELKIDLQLCLSWFQQYKGNIDEAMKGYDEVINQAYEIENPRLIADGRSIRGALYSYQGNFSKSLEDLVIAQQLYEQLNLTYWAQLNLGELATSYRRFGDPTSAIKYYTQLEQIFHEKGDVFSSIATNTDIALAQEELGNYQEALTRYKKSYQYFTENKLELARAQTAVNLSSTLLRMHRVDDAIQYLETVNTATLEKENAMSSFWYLFYAEAMFTKNEMDKALKYTKLAETAFQHEKNSRGMAMLYQLKSDIYQAIGQWEEAFFALKTYNELHSEIDKNTQSQRTTEMRTRFDSERIETENQRLIENQRLRDHELKILEQNKLLQLVVIILALIILLIVSVFAYKQVNKSKFLEVLALTDHLTKLANRRHSYTRGEVMFAQAKRTQSSMSVILFDADHFKKINDNYGHDIGDKVLIELSKTSLSLMRKHDLVGRVGGEEFLALLPHTNAAQAQDIAARLITQIASSSLKHVAPDLTITISAGVATLDNDSDFSQLVKRADNALYEAKSAGRNCAKTG